jgi:RIO kinase 1
VEIGLEERWAKRLERQEAIAEVRNRFLEKDRSLDRAAFEEVFDAQTLLTIYRLMKKGVIDDFYGVVSAGKESRIYHAKNGSGEELAVKIYLVNNREFRKGRLEYLVSDVRLGKVGGSVRKLIYMWAKREFLNLKQAHDAGVPVPKPYTVVNNVLVMGFIGENGQRYPLLRETELSVEEYAKIYSKVVEGMEVQYRRAELIHGDLSEYNVMCGPDLSVYFIDLSQAVLIHHPRADFYLMRDVRNVNRYFASKGVEVLEDEEFFERVAGRRPYELIA